MKIYTKKNQNIIEGRWWKINNNIKTSITAKYNKIKDWVMDPKGYFLIKIDREKNLIRVGYCIFSKLNKDSSTLKFNRFSDSNMESKHSITNDFMIPSGRLQL